MTDYKGGVKEGNMRDLYEVDVEPNKMLGMCDWFKNGKPINGIYVPAQILREVNDQLDAEQKQANL